MKRFASLIFFALRIVRVLPCGAMRCGAYTEGEAKPLHVVPCPCPCPFGQRAKGNTYAVTYHVPLRGIGEERAKVQ